MTPLLILLLACTPPGPERHEPGERPQDTAGPGDSQAGDSASSDTADSAEPQGPCPGHMLLVSDSFCVDGYEAALEERSGGSWKAASPYQTVDDRQVRAVPAAGIVPQAHISGDEAEQACAAAGKRLCSSEEWLLACQGPQAFTWPYGDSHQDGACNDDYAGSHPLVDYFGTSDGIWDSEHMNDPGINQQPGTVAPGGQYTGCESAWGAFDLHGNLHEWVADASGTFRGGFYADASINGPGCSYTTTAHSRSYHDYSTGFRCCSDPEDSPLAARPQPSPGSGAATPGTARSLRGSGP